MAEQGDHQAVNMDIINSGAGRTQHQPVVTLELPTPSKMTGGGGSVGKSPLNRMFQYGRGVIRRSSCKSIREDEDDSDDGSFSGLLSSHRIKRDIPHTPSIVSFSQPFEPKEPTIDPELSKFSSAVITGKIEYYRDGKNGLDQ